MKSSDYKSLVSSHLNTLHKDKGISFKKIAEVSGVPYDKIKSIRAGRSSGTLEDLLKLQLAYPELDEGNEPEDTRPISEQIKDLEKKFEDFQQRMLETSIEQRIKLENTLMEKLRVIEKLVDRELEKQEEEEKGKKKE